MTIQDCRVRPVVPADYPAWFEMWVDYCTFYAADIPASVTQSTWSRILNGDSHMHALIAVSASTGVAAGFANYVIHPFSWSERPACYLEDLFVKPADRGCSIGRLLIEQLMHLARVEGWAQLYWMTRENNVIARRLYDRFCKNDDFVRYSLAFDHNSPDPGASE